MYLGGGGVPELPGKTEPADRNGVDAASGFALAQKASSASDPDALPTLSIVVPTRHEAASIEAFLDRVLRAVTGISAEIVVVDDSDRDNTFEVLLRVKERVGESVVVVHRPQDSVAERTLGTAVVAGIRLARGAFVCVMDADGQHPPEAIPQMLDVALDTGADYVGGSR